MKAFGDNPLSRVRSVCDGSYTCERDDTDGCNGYGPSGQTQNGGLPISGCSGKMLYVLLQSNPSSPRQCTVSDFPKSQSTANRTAIF